MLVVTAPLAWGLTASCKLSVIMGTQYYDAGGAASADYPVTDLLAMMGRAAGPLHDDHSVCASAMRPGRSTTRNSVRTLPWSPPRSLPSRSHGGRDRDANHRDEAGRGRLSDLVVLLPPPESEPQLLQPDRGDAQAHLRRSLRTRGDDARGPRGEQVHQRRGRDGRRTAQPRDDRVVLLHLVHHHRALRREPHREDQAEGPDGDHRRRDRV